MGVNGVTKKDSVGNVVIIGSGPAGLTAAIYTARADLSPIVVEGEPSSTSDQPGGQLMLTTEIENYPGFPAGIMGPELMEAFKSQAVRFGAKIHPGKVTRVDISKQPFKIWVGNDNTASDTPDLLCKALIIASGARSLMLGLENESRLLGHGVSTCATCDGYFFRDLPIAVVGGGDSALEEALFLSKFAESVTIIHRRDQLRASKIMQDRVFSHPKIRVNWNSVIVDILGEEKVTGVKLRDTKTDEEYELKISGLFIAIGHVPNTGLFKNQLDTDEAGYIITDNSSKTSVAGVFACGDVQDHVYRQAITAAGSGCMAGIDTERWLENLTLGIKQS